MATDLSSPGWVLAQGVTGMTVSSLACLALLAIAGITFLGG